MKSLIKSVSKFGPMILVVLVLTIGLLVSADTVRGGPPLTRKDFTLAAPQGFGDRQNSWAWSMQWWNDHLYVGTNRAWHCAEIASFHYQFPNLFPYPPSDPDTKCTRNPKDLPLQAEIWRWTPATDTWERVYRSPKDVPISGGKFVARDVGYRGMSVFKEPTGTEALYVAGVSPRFIGYDEPSNMPPPRILRSTDGLNFEPVPQEPGTLLGDFPFGSFRNQTSYKGRFYIMGGIAQGSGVLLEADNPAGGNDNFRVVSPPGMVVSAIQPYNGYLYVGVRDFTNGYAIVKTDATGSPPYNYTTVVDQGGYLTGPGTNIEVLSMQVFHDRLYIGGNGLGMSFMGPGNAAELIRVSPDDSWDVVAGSPRLTPDGYKFPISGLLAGFGNFFNAHMWRMQVFDGNLCVGTFDASTLLKDDPSVEPLIRHLMGFDLYCTPNGIDFFPVTTRGFGGKFDFGVRSLEATPYGLFLGTANYYYGLQIWRTQPPYQIYLPLILKSSTATASSSSLPLALPITNTNTLLLPGFQPPGRVETELIGQAVVVSWEPVPGAVQYRLMRSEIETITLPLNVHLTSFSEDLSLAERPQTSQKREVLIWTPAGVIGITTSFYFVDDTVEVGRRYLYYVEALGKRGRKAAPSNIALAPTIARPETFTSLTAGLAEMQKQGYLTSEGESEIREAVATAQLLVQDSKLADAAQILADLRRGLDQKGQSLITDWKAEDLSRLLAKLERRVRLAQAGVISPLDLN